MSTTRYDESRTLGRGLRRLPDEAPSDFRKKVLGLLKHCREFTLDVSEICQWLMSLRPGGKRGNDGTRIFWEFFLEPEKFSGNADEEQGEVHRRLVFDVAADVMDETAISKSDIPQDLLNSLREVRKLPPSASAEKLFTRLAGYNPVRRQILLKAAAEWIFSTYWLSFGNWERRLDEWRKEKDEWEKYHQELTEEVRTEFGGIFKELEIKEKRPRVCGWKILEGKKDNCLYAGVRIKGKSHSQECGKFHAFWKRNKNFAEKAAHYLKCRKTGKREEAIEAVKRNCRNAGNFEQDWKEYLKAMGTDEKNILGKYKQTGKLPHCTEFGNEPECTINRHTEKCEQYRKRLDEKQHLREHEADYRKWRSEYLVAPKKPSFRYPSQSSLQVPKIFGKNFFDVDFERSAVRLRLDGFPGGFVEFGFKP